MEAHKEWSVNISFELDVFTGFSLFWKIRKERK